MSASSACCRMAMRARDRSIPRRGSSAFCRCAPKTTCRSRTARRRRTTSTSCAGSCKRDIRKPLILMTPKSLLRHKRAVSRLDELATGHLVPPRACGTMRNRCRTRRSSSLPDDKIRRVVLCSGKVYYDLYEEREKRGINDIYILRVEQLYPFPTKALVSELAALQAGARWSGARKSRATWAPGPSSPISIALDARADRRQAPHAALCRPSGVGIDRVGQMSEASGGAQAVPRRGAGAGYHDRAWRMRGKARTWLKSACRARRIGHRSDDRQWFKKRGRCGRRSTSRWSSSKPTR